MPFNKESSQIPSTIGSFSVVINTPNGVAPATINAFVDVLAGDGSIIRRVSLDLLPHLAGAQITTIETFMANLRTKAVVEMI